MAVPCDVVLMTWNWRALVPNEVVSTHLEKLLLAVELPMGSPTYLRPIFGMFLRRLFNGRLRVPYADICIGARALLTLRERYILYARQIVLAAAFTYGAYFT